MGFSGRERLDPVAAHLDGAFIRLMSAGDDLDQCRFTSAVLAQQRMHLSSPEVEGNAFERQDGTEGLGHGSQLEQTTHPVSRAIESSKKRRLDRESCESRNKYTTDNDKETN